MRDRVPDVLEKGRIRLSWGYHPGEWYGAFTVKCPGRRQLLILASPGDPGVWPFPGPPWEHVSVSILDTEAGNRGRTDTTPTWEEMSWVKWLFWGPGECVVQFHPPESEYVNYHAGCLHLWKPVGVDIPLPPAAAVGPKGA